MTNSRHTRRQWLHATSSAFVAAVAGCQRGAPSDQHVLKVFNWSDYIHEDAIAQFERQMGCTVVYDNYSSDAELETRVATGAGGYDVVFPSDRAMVALLGKDLLAPLDRGRIGNFQNLDPKFLGPTFDEANRFSVPYFWGTLAVGLRSDLGVRGDLAAGQTTGLELLFDPRNRGRITMLDDMENVVAAALSHLGLPLNSVEAPHLAAAQKLLLAQKPLVQAFTSDSYRERLVSGQAWAALGWSGDLLQAAAELEKISAVGNAIRGVPKKARVEVIVPAGGTMLWIDSMVIPRQAKNVELAHAFINHLLDPAVAAMNAVKVNYATPNAAARALLPPSMLADKSIYPPPEVIQRCTLLKDRGDDIEKIERVWRSVRA